MTREERAKQFMPFDAMKGLQEALRMREEQHLRVEKRDISDENREKISAEISKLTVGMKIYIYHYSDFHYKEKIGFVTEINNVFGFLKLDDQKIFYDDIFVIKAI